MKKQSYLIIGITLFACTVMGVVDALIQPGYVVKSIIKLSMFLLLPVIYARIDRSCDLKSLFRVDRKGILIAAGMGAAIFAVILGAFFLFRNVFDFSSLAGSLTSSTGVNKENFLFVAIYISLVNSLLEEFFFRGFSFLCLCRASKRWFAYIFSAGVFALYHIAMMIGWFSWIVVLLALTGIFIGGLIFSFFNEKYDNIYLSWLIHMCSNFAINIIGFILL